MLIRAPESIIMPDHATDLKPWTLAKGIGSFPEGPSAMLFRARLASDLGLIALRIIIQRRHPYPGVIHHSERGMQYAAYEYIDVLRVYQFPISMSCISDPYDNAGVESFLITLKTEEVHL